ncbi:MAG: hypothetical protein ABSE89_08655 [Sedimentisphaerales bacterium]
MRKEMQLLIHLLRPPIEWIKQHINYISFLLKIKGKTVFKYAGFCGKIAQKLRFIRLRPTYGVSKGLRDYGGQVGKPPFLLSQESTRASGLSSVVQADPKRTGEK